MLPHPDEPGLLNGEGQRARPPSRNPC